MSSCNVNNRPQPLRDNQGHIPPDTAMKMHEVYETALGGDQSQFSPSIAVRAEDRTDPPYLALSQHYTELVRSGLITTSRGRLEALDGTTAIIGPTPLASGRDSEKTTPLEDVAAVVLATGFDAAGCLSFLPEKVLEKLHYDPAAHDLPLALGFHGTQHRDVPTLGFVGFYRAPYWGVMEMQARFLAALWTPISETDATTDTNTNMTSRRPAGVDAAATGGDSCVRRTLSLRGDARRSQFPMGDYLFIMQEMAAALGLERSPSLQPASLTLPHNQLPMDIETPSRYQSLFADERARAETAEALRQANEAAVAGLTSSRFVAQAVFRSLLGEWQLERSLDSRLASHPSGHFSGTARFLVREATRDGLKCVVDGDAAGDGGDDGGNPGEEYLYIEEGEFRADNGMTFQARRRYVWRYDEARDVMSVWFVRTDDDRRADYLFHEVEFLGPEAWAEGGGAWKAQAGHLCIDDFYNVAYEFRFRAVELDEWTIGYRVKGPKKDYTIRGEYRRRGGRGQDYRIF